MSEDFTEIKVSQGIIKLRKPKAGDRNHALIESDGNQQLLVIKLLPKVIVEHPFGSQILEEALNNLEIPEYDSLVFAIKDMLGLGSDAEKKSKTPSGEETSKD